MISFVCCLICLALFLIEKVPAFAVVKQPLPRNIGMRGMPLGISIAAAILFPVLTIYTGCFGLLTLLASKNGKGAPLSLFSVRFTNISFSIIIALNIFGALMFLLYHFTWGKKNFESTLRDYGLTSEGASGINWMLIGRSFLLAVIIVMAGWTYLSIQKGVFGTDFYCLFWGCKPIPSVKFIYYIPYMIVWAICFAVAAVGMCVERRLPSTGSESLDHTIAVVFSLVLAVAGLAIVNTLETLLQLGAGHGNTVMADWGSLSRVYGACPSE